jgi:hypothetical protein
MKMIPFEDDKTKVKNKRKNNRERNSQSKGASNSKGPGERGGGSGAVKITGRDLVVSISSVNRIVKKLFHEIFRGRWE